MLFPEVNKSDQFNINQGSFISKIITVPTEKVYINMGKVKSKSKN